MGVTHTHGHPAALGAVPSLAYSWGNVFSFWLLGVLRVRWGWRAYQLEYICQQVTDNPIETECLKQKGFIFLT